MLTSSKISLMLILADFLVAKSQGSQNPQTSAFKSIKISCNSSSDSSSESSTLTLKDSSIDSSEIISDSRETSTEFDIFSGTEETEVTKSSEILSGDWSSEVNVVPSSSSTLTTESILFLHVPRDEISASSDDKEALMDSLHKHFTKRSTEFDIFSGTEEVEEAKSSEILSGDLSSEMDAPSLSPEVFPLVTEAPVEISIEDLIETSTEFDIFSGTEEFEIPKSSEIQSGDISSEKDIVPSSSATPTTESVFFSDISMDEIPDSPEHKRITALPKLTEAPVKVSTEDSSETSTESDIFSGTEEFEIPKSSDILSGDMSSETDIVPSSSATPTTEAVLFPDVSMTQKDSPEHKRTTTLPKLNAVPAKISTEDSSETSTEFDIFSGTEELEVPKSNEIQSGDMSSEIDIVPSSSATATTESVFFSDVSMDEIPDSLERKRNTAFPKLTEAPIAISIEDPTEASTEFDIFSGTKECEIPKSREILSGDMSSEIDIVPTSSATPTTESVFSSDVSMDEIPDSPEHKRITALPKLTEAPVKISTEDSPETSTEFDIFSGTEEFEIPKSNEIQSGDVSSEIDIVPTSTSTPTTEAVLFPDVSMTQKDSPEYKRTTTLPKLTTVPAKISTEDSPETSTEFDIFSGTEEFEIPKSNEIQSGDMSSEIDIVPSSSATPTTEAVFSPDVSVDEIPDSPEHKRTTALPKLTEVPIEISIEDPTETSTEFDIFSGTKEYEMPKSSEILSGDMSSETDIVPSSSATPTTEAVLFPDVSMTQKDSPEHKRTTALRKLTAVPAKISTEDSPETCTEFDIFSGTEELEVPKSNEIQSDDMSSEIDIVPSSSATPTTEAVFFSDVFMDEIPDSPEHKRTTVLPKLTEAPVKISTEDSPETSTEFDIFSGTEVFEIPKSNEIQSGDMSSETDIVPSSSAAPTTESVFSPDVSMDEVPDSPEHKRTTALPKLTEAPVKISTEDSPETSTEFDIFSGTEVFEIPKSNEIQSGDMSSETDIVPSSSAAPTTESVFSPDVSMDEVPDSPEHKRTTALPKVTEAPAKISREDTPETSTVFDIFSETEEFEIPKSNEIQSGDMSSEIDIVPSSSAAPTTEAVLFPDVPMDETSVSLHHKETTESVKPKESSDISTTPASIQNPTTVMPTNNEIFIFPSTTSIELVDSSDSVKLPEEQLSDAFNTSKFVSITVHKEKKTSVGVVFGIVLGSAVGAALLAAVAFLLYRKRKSNLFAHQRFFDEKNEPESSSSNAVLPTYCP
ncbi:mucin-15 isoform X2 [Notamacropus eugenii]|uniref:mucin-15 isoform X2 n=1 Tax=Notamacropus eugenii TaxID=9315 RepID=UPI003B67D731